MTVAKIAALPVAKIAADVAQLHLWTTDQFLEDAISIMKAWGFERKSTLIWAKPTAARANYWSEAHEYLLLGVRGGAEFATTARVRSVVKVAPEPTELRPALFRDLIEKVGSGPRLDLFGGEPVQGWVLGDSEVERDHHHQGVADLLNRYLSTWRSPPSPLWRICFAARKVTPPFVFPRDSGQIPRGHLQ